MGWFSGDVEVSFDTPPYVVVDKPFTYITDSGLVHTIPEGFRSDGASIPGIFRGIIGGRLDGKYRRAALLHDFGYFHNVQNKAYWDKIFREAMIADGVKFWRRNLMYRAVKWFGHGAWNTHRERDLAS